MNGAILVENEGLPRVAVCDHLHTLCPKLFSVANRWCCAADWVAMCKSEECITTISEFVFAPGELDAINGKGSFSGDCVILQHHDPANMRAGAYHGAAKHSRDLSRRGRSCRLQ